MPNAQTKFFIAAPFGNYLNFENAISVKGSYTMLHRPGLIKQLIKMGIAVEVGKQELIMVDAALLPLIM